MSDYEELKQKKIEELKRRYADQQEAEEKRLEAEMQISSILRTLLSEGARTRLNNVKLVNRELYIKAAQAIIYLYQSGNFNGKMSEDNLKELLQKLSMRKETKIRRK